MRNLRLVDAVIALHDIARTVEAETGTESIANEIRQIADRLHLYSLDDDKANTIAQSIIQQVKE
jgi:ABC-type hemin transport system substrate-binding protein